ncbi:MAG: GHKL domain-containing protein, partial [Clostridia bacterium]
IQLLNTFHIDSFKNILHSLICICLLLILKKITGRKSNLQNFKLMLTKNHIKSFLLIILLAILPQIILIIMNNYNYAPIFLALNFMQLLGISLFVFWYILNFLEKENLKIQNQTLEMDNKTLGGMVDGVRTIKHDFNNIFQAINGYICSKEYDDLEKYVLKVMKECNFVNTLSIINKNTFNDPAIYGVVGSKYFLATETGITMELDVTVNFKELEFPMPELSRILGILLDNAIEAASKSIDKYIRLEIKFNPRKNANIIKIYNTYDTNINIDLSSIYKKGYSSKKIKSGLGLWEVSKIISRNKNSQIYATIENNKFIQNIIIEICN